MIDKIKKILSSKIDPDLVKSLLDYYNELKQKFFLSQYEPSALNCSKFAEVVMRIIEYVAKGSYTPFGKYVYLDNLVEELEKLPKLDDSIRIHIPRILRAIYDIRNRRGVTHIGEINPNVMDATFLVSACNWIMAEFIRLYYTEEPNKAQKIVDSLVERQVPIIEKIGDKWKVLDTKLSISNQILLILYKKHPDYVSTSDLKSWIKTKSPTYITKVLWQLDKDAKIDLERKKSKITAKGIDYVEKILYKMIY